MKRTAKYYKSNSKARKVKAKYQKKYNATEREKENRINELYDIINNSTTEMPKEAREYNLLIDEVQDLRKEIKDIETSTQHSIEITPELKAAAEKGQPLFKEAEAQYRIESDKNIIEAIKDFDGSPRATVALTLEIMHPTVVSIIDGAYRDWETK